MFRAFFEDKEEKQYKTDMEDAMPFLKSLGIYVIGGRDVGKNTLDSVLRYDTTANTWSGVASMPTARYGHGVV